MLHYIVVSLNSYSSFVLFCFVVITVINIMAKSHVRRRQFKVHGKKPKAQGWNPEAGIEAEIAYDCCLRGLFPNSHWLPFYVFQTHVPKDGTTHSRLVPSTLICNLENSYNHAQILVWWRWFFSWEPFPPGMYSWQQRVAIVAIVLLWKALRKFFN